jgi:hypothetical protein
MNKQQTNLIGVWGKMRCGKDEIGSMIQYLTSDHGINGTRTYEESKGKVYRDGSAAGDFFRYTSEWENKKFADKLKDMVCLLIGCSRMDLENDEFKNSKLGPEWDGYLLTNGKLGLDVDKRPGFPLELTPRKMLQKLGTDLMRQQLHPNVWVNATFADYTPVGSHPSFAGPYDGIQEVDEYPKWIVSDVRFPNELEAIHERGGIVIHIKRPFSLRFPEYSEFGFEYDFNHDKLCNEDPEMCAKLTHASETSLDNINDFDYVIENDGTIDDLLAKVDEILIKENIK